VWGGYDRTPGRILREDETPKTYDTGRHSERPANEGRRTSKRPDREQNTPDGSWRPGCVSCCRPSFRTIGRGEMPFLNRYCIFLFLLLKYMQGLKVETVPLTKRASRRRSSSLLGPGAPLAGTVPRGRFGPSFHW
jgi:hypothetical protein